jgi:glycine betaine/proline transport system substrate-binding protein
MNRFRKNRLLAGLAFCAFILCGCTEQQDGAGRKGEVELVYVEWSSEVASTNVVRAVLEQQGYEVKTTPVSAAAMWQAVASGDADAMVAAWLPTTHAHYLQRVKDDVVDLGPNLEGTRIGLVVPDYVDIDSIDQLNRHADRFDNRIIGIDPGAGLMSKTEEAIAAYHLELKLVEGSGATMAAALGDAIAAGKWIVVTGWTPHWKFSRWDLKYLDDPKRIYGASGHIDTIVRKGLREALPQVYRILDRFHWTAAEMEELMAMNKAQGADPYRNAQRWVADHPDRVAEWVDDAASPARE